MKKLVMISLIMIMILSSSFVGATTIVDDIDFWSTHNTYYGPDQTLLTWKDGARISKFDTLNYTHDYTPIQGMEVESMDITLEFASVYLDYFCLQSFEGFDIMNETGDSISRNTDGNFVFSVMENRELYGAINDIVMLEIETIGLNVNLSIVNSFGKSIWLDSSVLTTETNSPAPVPEPATAVMMLIGISLFSVKRFFRKNK